MAKKLMILIVLTLFPAMAFSSLPAGMQTSKIRIRKQTFIVELADEDTEYCIGLGYRDRMEENHGMLFIYETRSRHGFWMQGMKFPLDFLWIDGREIVDITRDVAEPAGGETLPIIRPSIPVDKVLELNAGAANKYGLSIGDTIEFVK